MLWTDAHSIRAPVLLGYADNKIGLSEFGKDYTPQYTQTEWNIIAPFSDAVSIKLLFTDFNSKLIYWSLRTVRALCFAQTHTPTQRHETSPMLRPIQRHNIWLSSGISKAYSFLVCLIVTRISTGAY